MRCFTHIHTESLCAGQDTHSQAGSKKSCVVSSGGKPWLLLPNQERHLVEQQVEKVSLQNQTNHSYCCNTNKTHTYNSQCVKLCGDTIPAMWFLPGNTSQGGGKNTLLKQVSVVCVKKELGNRELHIFAHHLAFGVRVYGFPLKQRFTSIT